MRRLKSHPVVNGKNSMHSMHEICGLFRASCNFMVITLCRYIPWLGVKNFLYQHLLGMKIGTNAAVGLMAMFDIFLPQYISIGQNSIIGYNVTILAHEFLVTEYRVGKVTIGDEVLIGANSTILAGVTIGNQSIVAAGSVVTDDVPPGVMVGGIPARIIKNIWNS
jgi:acetyltransferase-like isoleucine patch superfamily enzyme